MANKKDLTEEEKKRALLLNQKPVTLLPDVELELIANHYGMEFEGGLKEARLLSIIHDLEKKLKPVS